MKRLVLFFIFAALAALPACKKKSPPPAEKAAALPAQPAEEPAAIPAPAPDVVELVPTAAAPDIVTPPGGGGDVKDPWAEYVVIGSMDPNTGPPAPPVAEAEADRAMDLAKGWTAVPVKRGEGDPPPDISRPKEAALAIETLNNRGLYVFEIMALEQDVEYFVQKLLPDAADYLEFRGNLGINITANDLKPLEQHLRKEFAERMAKYHRYVGPVRREDRFGVMVNRRMTRLTRWTFQYEDKSGVLQQDCLLFILLAKGWCMLDFGCDDEPWLAPADFTAPPPAEGDVTSEGDLPMGDVRSQPEPTPGGDVASPGTGAGAAL